MLNVLLGGRWEISVLEGGQVRLMSVAVGDGLAIVRGTVGLAILLSAGGILDERLGLGSIIAQVLLCDLSGLFSVLSDKAADLMSLVIDDLAGVSKLAVDELLVGGIYERSEESDRGSNQGQSPVGNNLDEVVRDEGSESSLVVGSLAERSDAIAPGALGHAGFKVETYSNRNPDVLGKQNALGLDDEKVDDVGNIAHEGFQSLLGNGIVLARAELGCETIVENKLSSNLSGNSDAKSHPGELQTVTNKIEIPKRENERDRGSIGNAGSPCASC